MEINRLGEVIAFDYFFVLNKFQYFCSSRLSSAYRFSQKVEFQHQKIILV